MKSKMICLTLLICTLAACQHFKASTDVDGETVQLTGTIRLTESTNYCSEGFNNYRLYSVSDSTETRLCVMKEPNDYTQPCLPNVLKKDGLRVRFSGILQPVPSNVRSCPRIVLQNIEPLN